MADLPPELNVLEEGVPAEARVLFKSVARGHVTNAVTEQAARVSHRLLEVRRRGVRIARGVEEQRMPALRADVLVTAVAIGEFLVVVLAEKTRQGVTNVCDGAILGEVLGPTTAAPPFSSRLLEDVSST